MVTYCEIIINRGVLIFVDFMVHLNHENKNPMKYNFLTDCCLECFKPRIQDLMYFVDTTKIGANEYKYFDSETDGHLIQV